MRYHLSSRNVLVPVSLIILVTLALLLGTTLVSAETCPATGIWPKDCTSATSTNNNASSSTSLGEPCPTDGTWPAGCVPSGNNTDTRNTPPNNAETTPVVPCPRNGVWTPGCKPGGAAPQSSGNADDSGNTCPPTGSWPAGCVPSGAAPPRPAPSSNHSSDADIIIFSIFYEGNIPRVESDEHVNIRNIGRTNVNLAGYWIDAGDGEKFTFPDYEIRPWQICRVYTNFNKQENCSFSFGSEQPVWNNSSECGRLYNAEGKLISEYCYE